MADIDDYLGSCPLSRYPTRTSPAVLGHLYARARRPARPSGPLSAVQGQG
jgi:hypothetical protein